MILVKIRLSILIIVCIILSTLGFVPPAFDSDVKQLFPSVFILYFPFFNFLGMSRYLSIYFDFWVVYNSRCRSSALDKTKTAIIVL